MVCGNIKLRPAAPRRPAVRLTINEFSFKGCFGIPFFCLYIFTFLPYPMDKIFFDNWESIVRIAINTVLAYAAMVILLRVSGKRTLSKMNAFDFIVTVALGSSLATVALSKSVPLLDGVLAFVLFVSLQYCLTWLSVRFKVVKQIITNDPVLLLYQGKMLHDVMKRERVTEDEIYVAARENGTTDLQDIHAIILETTGTISVISERNAQVADAMHDIENYPGTA